MKAIDPSPYVAAYGILVFLAPWLVCMSFNVRKLLYARRTGISLWSWGASEQIRTLRQTDPYAAHLHQRLVMCFQILVGPEQALSAQELKVVKEAVHGSMARFLRPFF